MNVHARNLAIIKVMALLLAACQTSASLHGLNNQTKSFVSPKEISRADWSDPAELNRTWQSALVRIPSGPRSYISTTMRDWKEQSTGAIKPYPTIIHLHGCSGIHAGTIERIDFYAKNGFAVIAPASFARLKYDQSCDPSAYEGGMSPHALEMRRRDAGFAIEMAKNLSWVDTDNVVLAGQSQGGFTTAIFRAANFNQLVKARIIEGADCQMGGHNYYGLRAPSSEPVLALVGTGDPWFVNKRPVPGDCGQFMDRSNGSRSVVYRDGYLAAQHSLLIHSSVQETVLKFLAEQVRRVAVRPPLIAVGATIRGISARTGKPYRIVLGSGGRATVAFEGKGGGQKLSDQGTWKIENGLKLCVRFSRFSRGRALCRPTVMQNGHLTDVTPNRGTTKPWKIE